VNDNILADQFDRLEAGSVRSLEQLERFLDRFAADIIRQPTHEVCALRTAGDERHFEVAGSLPSPASLESLKWHLAKMAFEDITISAKVLPNFELPPIAAFEDRELPFFSRAEQTIEGSCEIDPESETVHVWNTGDPICPIEQVDDRMLCQTGTGYLAWINTPDYLYPNSEVATFPAMEPEALISEEQVLEATSKFLDVPYIWGACSKEGTDCSGFTQTVYLESFGLSLPRDSHQQMLGGTIVATHDTRRPLAPGDLLFFTHKDGRLRHVGISLGGWKMIHAEEPVVTICSLNPNDEDFDTFRHGHFVLAKRYLLRQPV